MFVINLCASIAPVQPGGKNLPGLENYRLYQVARVEDGRTRHRLRLGFFTSESHAESVLTVVRQQYPTAFTSCLSDEDRKFTRGYLPDTTTAAPSAAPKPAVAVVAPAPAVARHPPAKAEAPKSPVAAANATVTSAPAVRANAKAAASTKSVKAPHAKPQANANAEVIEVTWEAPASARKEQTTKAAPKTPAIDTEVALDDFSWEPPALQPAAPAAEDSTATTARHPVLSPVYKTQPVVKSAPAAKAAPKPAPPPKADPASSMRIKAPDLTFSDPPAQTAQKPAVKSNEPFHVAKGVEIGDLRISLQPEAPVRTVAAPRPPLRRQRVHRRQGPPLLHRKKSRRSCSSRRSLRLWRVRRRLETHVPDLDSTQTIRALTSATFGTARTILTCCASPTCTPTTARATSCTASTFDVGEGEIVSLLGRNGSGRSTTVKAIMGLVAAEGSVALARARRSSAARPSTSPTAASATCPRTATSFRS